MGIKKVEELGDRVKIYYCLSKPWGENDIFGVWEVFYKDIDKLPEAYEVPDDDEPAMECHWSEEIEIKKIGKTIQYHFSDYQETVACRSESFEGGPI